MRRAGVGLITCVALLIALAPAQRASAALPKLSIKDAVANEVDGVATVKIVLSRASTRKVSATYVTGENTAGAPGDYTNSMATITFKPGQVRKKITIPIVDDDDSEPAETFTVQIVDSTRASIADDIATVAIVDNEPVIVSSLLVEPDGNTIKQDATQQFTVTATFSDGTSDDVTADAAWSSTFPSIAQVSDTAGTKGLATGIDQGSTPIRADFGGETDTAPLNITCRDHSNGLGQTYSDCSALGTYTGTTAQKAAQAWNPMGTISTATCNTGFVSVIVNQTATQAAVWAYSGATTGRVRLNPSSNTALCPTGTDPQWN